MKYSYLSIVLLCVSPALAQDGDREDPSEQIAPIPADEIPASPYLGLEDSLKTFEVAEGFQLDAIAHGEIVRMPVAMDFDEDGRAWVVEMRNYMTDLDGSDENEPNGQIRILEDSNGDGNLDTATVFLDDLVLPRAVSVTPGGLVYCSDDRLYFIKRDGLKPVGARELIDADYAPGGNAEHKANGFIRGLDNWYYNAKSDKRYRRVNGKWIIEKTLFRGQWGIAQDNYGRLYYNHNSSLLQADSFRPGLSLKFPNIGLNNTPMTGLGNKVKPIRMNPGVNRGYTGILDKKTGKLHKVTSAAGMTIYRGQNFPKEYVGRSLTAAPCVNTVAMLDLKRRADQSTKSSNPFKTKDIIASTDEWFRPVNVYTAPDGSVWILDLHFGLIQHKAYMTSYLRNQYESRGLDKPTTHAGRIYRLRYRANPLGKVPQLSNASVAELVGFLGHVNGTVRDKAQSLLVNKIEKDAEAYQDLIAYATRVGLATENDLQLVHILWTLEAAKQISSKLLAKAMDADSTELQTVALELAHLADTPLTKKVISYEPKMETLHSYCYAMGANASNESVARLEQVMKKFPKFKYAQDLFIVGARHLKEAPEVKQLNSNNKRLQQLLTAIHGAVKVKVKKSGEGLSGEHLASYQRGKEVFTAAACASCHGQDGKGQGTTGVPPLSPSDWVVGDKTVLGKVILNGLTGPITVNGVGVETAMAMPPYLNNPLVKDDKALADLLNYLRNMGSNNGAFVSEKEAKEIREEASKRVLPWTEADLRFKIK